MAARLCSGEMLGAFGLTEPDGGSDAGATQTARLDPETDEWVINGTKCFITNSGTDITGLVAVTAVAEAQPDGRPRISAIIVPSGTPGFTVAAPYSKVGWNASDTRKLSFSDVRVPAANLLGEEGRGYAQFLHILDEGRIAIAALATGLAQGCVDESLKYAKEREAFGRPIGANQAIQFKLADMEMRAHTARLAWRDAASRLVNGDPFKKEAALAKLHSSTIAVDNARDATQIHGGYGFINEYPVARMWRNSQDPGDRRGHERGPADADRSGVGAGGIGNRRQPEPTSTGVESRAPGHTRPRGPAFVRPPPRPPWTEYG
ncbi:Crotonobetainyl-CoA reductase [Streptomyces alboniger]